MTLKAGKYVAAVEFENDGQLKGDEIEIRLSV